MDKDTIKTALAVATVVVAASYAVDGFIKAGKSIAKENRRKKAAKKEN